MVWYNNAKRGGSNERNSKTQTNPHNIYDKLGTETLTGFAAQGEHTMTIYYMDRGEGRTNCYVQFNLPQRDTIEVTKKFDNSKNDDGEVTSIDADELANYGGREFGFTLYNNGEAVANKTYYVYDENNNLIRPASTDAYGHFVLHRNETARFLVEIGTNDTYQVVEDTMTVEVDGFLAPQWTYKTNITGATATAETVTAFPGMTVTATGSNSAADTISFVCENYLSANVPNPGVLTQPDRVVIDYGLPVTLTYSDITKNDIIRGNNLEGTNVTFTLTGNGGTYGTAVLDDKGTPSVLDDTVTYTLNKQLIGIETLSYSIMVTTYGNDGTEDKVYEGVGSGTILIMPATSVYYEENFAAPATTPATGDIQYGLVTYSNGTIKWNPVGTSLNLIQETGLVGTANDSTYGTDTAYLTGTGDTNGTSMMVEMNTTNSARFEYDFTGTGTAIYGRISRVTGYIQVIVTNAKTGDVVDWQNIDTMMLDNVAGAGTLYNVPIYQHESFTHGDYHVKVTVFHAGTPTDVEGGSGDEFYLDGIRIYNLVVNDATVNAAYAADGEANTVVINICDKILGDFEDGWLTDDYGNLINKFFTLTDVNGEKVDGVYPNGETDTIDDYYAYGPNHEFYLNNPGTDNKVYTVSFKLINWDSTLYTLYLGMKAPAGTATVNVGGTDIEIKNSADCYYDISKYVKVENVNMDGNNEVDTAIGTVTITGVTGLVSLTNIKVTGTEEFLLGDSEDIETYSEDPDPEGPGAGDSEEPVVYSRMLYMVPATFSFAPAEEEIPVFEPEKLDVSCVYSKFLRTAIVTVQSSQDVETLTVNGVEVRPIQLWNTNVYIYTVTRVPSGTVLEVVAYDSEGVASEPTTVIAE